MIDILVSDVTIHNFDMISIRCYIMYLIYGTFRYDACILTHLVNTMWLEIQSTRVVNEQ